MIHATEFGLWLEVAWVVNPHLRPPQDDEADERMGRAMDMCGPGDDIFEIYDALRAQETGGE